MRKTNINVALREILKSTFTIFDKKKKDNICKDSVDTTAFK